MFTLSEIKDLIDHCKARKVQDLSVGDLKIVFAGEVLETEQVDESDIYDVQDVLLAEEGSSHGNS